MSLIVLVLAIVLSFVRKTNCGITAIGCVAILTAIYKIPIKTVISGFNSSLFVTLVGVTYLFAIVRNNGTLNLIADKLIAPFHKKVWLIPIVIYCVGFILCAVGPGAIPNLAIVPIFAVSVAEAVGLNPVMLSIIGVAGVWGGRMSPITPETLVVTNLLAKDGVKAGIMSLWVPVFVVSLIMAIIPFIYYKGWRIDTTKPHHIGQTAALNRNQIFSVIGIIIMIIAALVFNFNVGLASFLVGTILILIGAGDEKKSIKAIPWNIIMLVMGMGILMNVVVASGGIKIMSNALSSIMTKHTGAAIMELIAGIMSFFSSGLGVVFPTLIPTVAEISQHLGGVVSPVALAISVVIGGTITGVSPVGTAGGLILAANASSDEKNESSSSKLFIELFAWAIVATIIGVIVGLLGIFN